MSALSQQTRWLQWTSACDKNSLLISLSGQEALSACFRYEADVIATDLAWDPSKIVGEKVSIKVMQPDENNQLQLNRYVHGVVTQVVFLNTLNYTADQSALTMRQYRCVIEPQLALLKSTRNNRIFQKKSQSTLDIIKQVIDLYGIELDASQVKGVVNRPYCMQYQESDYAFLMRLFGMSGLYFYFKHSSDSHTLVLSDQSSGYLTDVSSEVYENAQSNQSGTLQSVELSYQVLPGKLSINNQLLMNPGQSISASLDITASHQSTSLTAQCNQFTNVINCESNGIAKQYLQAQNAHYEASAMTLSAESSQPLQLAQLLQLQGQAFADFNVKAYVLTALQLEVEDKRGIVNEPDNATPTAQSFFSAMDKTQISPLPYQQPTVAVGLQLAQVVNSKGTTDSSQVYNYDELGRVCVKFSWEGYEGAGIEANQFDQCLISSPSAWDDGILRVGTMVLVGFINNDYDRPVIVNAINNANQLLLGKYNSENAAKSILQRIPGVDTVDYNTIEFNDKDSKQALTITAPNELNGNSKKETYTTENHSRTVKEAYSLEAKSEKYESKGLKRNVDGKYELNADDIIIKGDLTLTGNLKVNGNVDIE